MGKTKKGRVSGKKKVKKSFLDIQKRKRNEFKKKTSGKKNPDEEAKPRKAFRFENFADQIASVDYSIVYQLAGAANLTKVSDELKTSVFRETFEHWRELNLTAEFTEIVKKLNQFVTLPQVIFSQSSIVEILRVGLKDSTPLSVQPILELIAGLATDLQHEFYPNLEIFVELITITTLKVQDANVIKWAFRCLGHLLKILWRPISSNLEQVYGYFKNLFELKQPDYIRYLGAETVSFLIRKSRDKENFCKFILTQMTETTDHVAVAKLFFESIKTVNAQFNNNLEPSWRIFLRLLPGDFNEILKNIFQFSCDHTGPENVDPILRITLEKVDETMKNKNETSEISNEEIEISKAGQDGQTNIILYCLEILITNKQGRLIKDFKSLFCFFNGLVEKGCASDELMNCIKSVVESEKIVKTEDQVRETVCLVLETGFSNQQKMDFVSEFDDESIFDRYLLKPYLAFVQREIKENFEPLSAHLAEILLQRNPACEYGSEMESYSSFSIDLQLVPALRKIKTEDLFPTLCLEKIDQNYSAETIKHALVICSSIRPISSEKVLKKITTLSRQVLAKKDWSLVPVLPLALQAVSSLSCPKTVVEYFDVARIAELLLEDPNRDILKLFNFALTCESWTETCRLSSETLELIITRLLPLLSDPKPQVRQLTLHSLSLILASLGEKYTKIPEENYLSALNLVETMLAAERTPENLSEYKKKLNLLQRVEAERLHSSIRNDERLNTMPLRYLLGCLYTNFTLLWVPVQNLVAGYGNYIKREHFWNIFGAKLVSADQDIQTYLRELQDGSYSRSNEASKRVDYIKYRNQLWGLLNKFSDVSEAKNRDLVSLFLDNFCTVEYKTIRGLSDNRNVWLNHKEVINSTINSLISHLNVFTSFKDLKSLHRVDEVKSKVDELLSHRVAPVQRIALEILIAFKLKFILPYKDNLLKLLDDKDFKSELVGFPLGEESSEIKQEHRDQVIPVVLRILYGRMRAVKKGKKDGGKGAVSSRRTLILHHLMDLSEVHIRYFLDLVYSELYSGSGIKEGQNVYEYILQGGKAPEKSIKMLQASVEMLQSVINKLGKLMVKNLDYILETIVWIGFIVSSHHDTHGKVVGYKAVRNAVYSQLASFFSRFTEYEFSSQAETAIFQMFVWKPLENFDKDYIHSPSGLLQLILCWSREPKYRRYLQVKQPKLRTRILQNIVKVLLKPTTAGKVVDCVLEVINNLVTPVDDMETEEETNYDQIGIEIALAELDTVLIHFNTWIQASNKNVKMLKKVGLKLDILTQLAPHISKPEVASDFLNQLFVMLGSIKKPETICKVLVITQYLVEKVPLENLNSIVELTVPYFSKLATRQERTELSNFMSKLSEKEESLKTLCDICINLNAYDRKRFEEPDFEVRMNEFIKIRDNLRKDVEFSLEELRAVFFNCSFFLQHEKDSSLRSNSLDTLVTVCQGIKKLGERDQDSARKMINKVCLEQIKRGIKSKDDMVRCDFISVLHKLVLSCQDINSRLKDLAKLSISADIDTDFFENVRHVQLHRRGRALTRLAKQLEDDEKYLSERNLTQLILPLCTTYLLNPDYVKHSQLVEQAIVLFGAICKTLPWAQYEIYIKYYTGLFNKQETPHQRQLVKITTEILNAFHFSLNPNEEGLEEKEKELRKKIHFTVNNSLLPNLTGTLAGKTKGPIALSDEDQLIQRVPLAVPIVRILQLNTKQVLERSVPGIIAKIASFLRSKAVEIREAARSTLCSVMELLGARFISFVVRELSSFLTRGYQVHVLTYTIHNMLHFMAEKSLIQPGDIDSSVGQLAELALSEMFGVTAEEKDVKKITGKLLEAKNTKSYDTLQITARFLSNQELMSLVKPFSEKLSNLSAFKNIVKIKECMRNIVLGLLANTALDPIFAMTFIFGVITDQIKLGRDQKVKKEKPKPIYEIPDSFLVPKAPKRGGAMAKTAASTSQYVIHEFGLNLLYFLLKRASIDPTNPEHQARLSPFFPVLTDFLSASHASVVTVSLRCFQWVVKVPLEAKTDENVMELTNKVFGLLKKYGGGTDGRGENHDLVVMASKLLVILIRDVKLTQIKDDQLKLIFDYILVDVLDPLKQTTAFGLLAAVLGRKLVSPDLHDIMMKLIEMSIQSHSQQVRQSAKMAVITYVANYDLKKKLGRILDVYTAQLSYEVEVGRLMAADAIRSIIITLGNKVNPHAPFLFISIAPFLINEESTECKKALANTLSALLNVLPEATIETLKKSTMTWFRGKNIAHAQLACRILVIFVDTLGIQVLRLELTEISEKLPKFFRGSDSLCIQALSLLQRIVRLDLENIFWKSSDICAGVHTCLLHPHAWVRLLSSQLIGLFLSRLLESPELTWLNDMDTLKSIILDSFEQLNLTDSVTEDTSLQVVKNLVALTKLIISRTDEKLTLKYVMKKAVKISNNELISAPKNTVRRTLIFNYIAAVCLQSSPSQVEDLLRVILPPLQREISSSSSNPELKSHTHEVLELVKTKVEDEVYTRTLLEVQMDITKKRGERSAARKQTLILHPKVAAKRKIQQNQAKKNAKKARRMN